jgi:hypothetical protein
LITDRVHIYHQVTTCGSFTGARTSSFRSRPQKLL